MLAYFKKIKADLSLDLVKRNDVFNYGYVEVFESIRRKALAHKSAQVYQTIFQIVNGVAGGCDNLGIVPNLCIHFFKGFHGIVFF